MAGTTRGIQYERHDTGKDELERIQDNMQRTVEQINRRTIITGVEMPAAASVAIKHSLGRAPARWWPVRVTVGYFEAFETARDAETLTLASTNACTADIEVE